jgi:hypothetical protein
MECPTATTLFDKYARAAVEYFEASDDLSNLVGHHDRFAEGKKFAEQTLQRCRTARLALEQHRAEHNCRASGTGIG